MRRTSRKDMLKVKWQHPIRTRLLCALTLVLFPVLVVVSVVWDGAKNTTMYDIKEGFATLVATAFLPWSD